MALADTTPQVFSTAAKHVPVPARVKIGAGVAAALAIAAVMGPQVAARVAPEKTFKTFGFLGSSLRETFIGTSLNEGAAAEAVKAVPPGHTVALVHAAFVQEFVRRGEHDPAFDNARMEIFVGHQAPSHFARVFSSGNNFSIPVCHRQANSDFSSEITITGKQAKELVGMIQQFSGRVAKSPGQNGIGHCANLG